MIQILIVLLVNCAISDKIEILSIQNTSAWKRTKCGFNGTDIITKWGKQVDPSNASTLLPEYPRPQLIRGNINDTYVNINGLWEFQIAENNASILSPPFNKTLSKQILVPFPVESCLSGIGENHQYLWYRLLFSINESWINIKNNNHKLLLQFGAIDWKSTIFINGNNIMTHYGGYDTFSIDLTSSLTQNYNEILIFVYDPSNKGLQPAGKQNIARMTQPKGGQFTPSSGIWQTVWLEKVNKNHVENIKISTDLNYINITAIGRSNNGNVDIKIIDPLDKHIVYNGTTTINKTLNVSIKSPKLWSPSTPNLYTIQMNYDNDYIESYAGMRTISIKPTVKRPFMADTGVEQRVGRMNGGGKIINGYPISINNYNDCWYKCNQTDNCLAWNFQCAQDNNNTNALCYLYSNEIPSDKLIFDHCSTSGGKNISAQNVMMPHLNDKPINMAGWLDQSFYPDGLYSPPSNQILYFDINSVLQFGFNFARLHQKVQPELYYYYADILGVLIWQDMPQKYSSNEELIPYFIDDLTKMVTQKYNHPSIIQWEIFNENDCVQAFKPYKDNKYNVSIDDMYNLVKNLDDTRLIDIDSGGIGSGSHIGDVFDIHYYPNLTHVESSKIQYGAQGEFGSCAMGKINGHEWVNNGCETYYGCDGPKNDDDVVIKFYSNQVDLVLSDLVKYDVHATVYTEITDIETECHGFHTYDRINKYNQTQTDMFKSMNQRLINRN